jgi:DNA primase
MLPSAGGTVQIHFLMLSEGDDPDAFVRRDGPDAFRALLAKSLPLSDFLLTELSRQVDLKTVDGRSRLTALSMPLLERVPEGIYRELLQTRLAELIGLPAARFAQLLRPTRPSNPPPAPEPDGPALGKSSLIRSAIVLTLNFPEIAATVDVPAELDEVNQAGARLLRRLLDLCREDPGTKAAGLMERLREDPEGRYLGRLAGQPCLEEHESAGAVLSDSLQRIVGTYRRERLSALLARQADLTPAEQQELRRLSQFH